MNALINEYWYSMATIQELQKKVADWQGREISNSYARLVNEKEIVCSRKSSKWARLYYSINTNCTYWDLQNGHLLDCPQNTDITDYWLTFSMHNSKKPTTEKNILRDLSSVILEERSTRSLKQITAAPELL